MPGVFISYRRADSGTMVGRMYDDLAEAFGAKVFFRDIHNIRAGQDFRQVLQNTLKRCRVVIVVIGPQWVTIRDEFGNYRLWQDNDYVRMEVETALSTPGKHVIPVLVGGAQMPQAQQLPPSLGQLPYRNYVPVRDDLDYYNDMNRLKGEVAYYLGIKPRKKRSSGLPLTWIIGGGAAAMFAGLLLVIALVLGSNGLTGNSNDNGNDGDQRIIAPTAVPVGGQTGGSGGQEIGSLTGSVGGMDPFSGARYSVNYPSNWFGNNESMDALPVALISTNNMTMFEVNTSDSVPSGEVVIVVMFLSYDFAFQSYGYVPSAAEIMSLADMGGISSGGTNIGNVSNVNLGGSNASRATFSSPGGSGVIIILEENAGYAMLIAMSSDGTAQVNGTINEIAASVRYG